MSRLGFCSILGLVIFSCTIFSCQRQQRVPCIREFIYQQTKAVGPEAFVCILKTNDNNLDRLLAEKSNRFIYNYSGGIYNIDTLGFSSSSPCYVIYEGTDNSIKLIQIVFGLSRIPTNTLDSLIKKTEKDICIELLDTITKKRWILRKCNN